MKGIQKVFIVGYYGFENAGDEAILRAIVTDLRALRPDLSVTAVSGNPARTNEIHGIAAISWHDSVAIFDAVSEADLTIVGGGGIFHDYWGFDPDLFLTDRQSGIAFYTAPAVLAALLGKPLMLYAVGVGPLLSGHAKRFTRVACEAACAITVRDADSRRWLESIGVRGERITVTADPVFTLSPEDRGGGLDALLPPGTDARKPLVAVSVRDWDAGVDSSFWEREFAAGLDRFLASEGGTVVFVPFGRLPGKRENDQAVSERVQSLMRRRDNTAVISRDLRPDELLKFFGSCDLTVGMRLHSVMFSALNHVPFVAVSYDPKVISFVERIGATDVIDIGSLEADVLARAMSHALAGTAEFRATLPEKLGTLAGLARQNAEIALGAAVHGQRTPGYWPSPELSSLLVRALRAQLHAGRSLQCEMRNLSGVLAGVEADRDEGRRFLTHENQVLARQLEETSSFLARLQADDGRLRAEIDTLNRFQQSQNEAIARIDQDRQALREELEKARRFQQAQEEALSRMDASRSRLLEEREAQRQLQQATENALAKLEAERSSLARNTRDSVAKAIRLETDVDFLSNQLRSTQEKLHQNEEKLRVERDARISAEHELATSAASLRASGVARQVTSAAIEEYRKKFDYELRVLRSQRAWKAMLYLRGAYTLLVRQGWRGWLRFPKWTLTAPFTRSGLEEYELRFPDIEHDLPAPFTAPPLTPAVENSFGEAAGPERLGPAQRNKYDVVILGIIDFDFRFQRPQQIAAQFARAGHRVFWISPARFLAPSAEEPYEVVPLRENIWEIHLRGPQPDVYLGRLDPPVARTLAASLECLFRDQAIAENLLLLQLPFWRQIGLAVREKFGSILAYDCMDDWETFENMGAFNVLEEKNLAVECDVLVVTGKGLEDKFQARGIDCILVRNGADFEFFSTAHSANLLAGIPHPIVGYFGAIADWIDLDLVREVATLRPQYSFVLIGQVFGRDVSALECLPNVYLLGNQRYELIPSFLADFDCCTIPFLLNQVTRATDPVKIYEYLSQGKPAIATDMAELAQCGDLVYIGKDPDDFASKIDAAVGETGNGLRQRRIEFARSNTWTKRVEALDARVRRQFPLVSILIVTYNSAEFVVPCMDAIRDCTAYPAWEAIVVDNGSSDETPELLRKYAAADRRIQIECLAKNTGFAAGNNRAARKARGEYLILLNIDTMVTSGWIERMLRHIRRDPSIGIICPVTNFAGNEIKINFDYSGAGQMQDFALQVAREQQGRVLDIDVAPLYCALIPRKVWNEAGELDEGFGLGMYEDDDFCMRVREAGYRVTAAEDCFVHHFGQGSFSKLPSAEYQTIFDSNRKRFEDKWKIAWKPHKTRPGIRPAFEEIKFTPGEFYPAGK